MGIIRHIPTKPTRTYFTRLSSPLSFEAACVWSYMCLLLYRRLHYAFDSTGLPYQAADDKLDVPITWARHMYGHLLSI